LLPGALGDEGSVEAESFTEHLLDCPQYTRPDVVDGMTVPSVLMKGDHAAIRRWRLKQALGRTSERRPDLLAQRRLTAQEQDLLREYIAECGVSRS